MATTTLVAKAQEALEVELQRFVGDTTHRSVAVHVLNDPPLRAEIAADVVRPAASFLKLLPTLALYDASERGEIDLDATVARRELGDTAYPSILAAFQDERRLTLREVCALSLMTSDNPAAEYIRRLVDPDRIKGICENLRLSRTALIVGFTDGELGAIGRRNVSTAREALRIIEHIEASPRLGELRRFLVNNLRNTRIPARLEDEFPVMHKTGSLATVVNDVGVIHTPRARIALAYLCADEADTVLAAVNIGDSALRVVEIVSQLHT
ncbi:MAG TPA: serine hydrolase [Actinomycetes bacterium]|nr:serine hydrolase [Actinomycetes bacterium]